MSSNTHYPIPFGPHNNSVKSPHRVFIAVKDLSAHPLHVVPSVYEEDPEAQICDMFGPGVTWEAELGEPEPGLLVPGPWSFGHVQSGGARVA